MAITHPRSLVVDYPIGILREAITLIALKPKGTAPNMWVYLRVFRVTQWAIIWTLLSALVIAMTLMSALWVCHTTRLLSVGMWNVNEWMNVITPEIGYQFSMLKLDSPSRQRHVRNLAATKWSQNERLTHRGDDRRHVGRRHGEDWRSWGFQMEGIWPYFQVIPLLLRALALSLISQV